MPPKKTSKRSLKNRGRWFAFTWNNPNPDDVPDIFESFNGSEVRFILGQLERGEEEGTLHFQGAALFHSSTRVNKARIVLQGVMAGAHVETAKAPAALRKYVTKEKTRVSGPYSWGEDPHQGKRNDLEMIRDLARQGCSMMDIADEYPSAPDRCRHLIRAGQADYFRRLAFQRFRDFTSHERKKKVRYLYGAPRTGKTRYVFENVPSEDLFELRKDNKGTAWFDGYEGQRCLLLDDYVGYLPATLFLRLTDIYPVRVSIKGDFVWVNFDEVYICSNIDPELIHGKIQDVEVARAIRTRLSHQSDVIDSRSWQVVPKVDPDGNPSLDFQPWNFRLDY